MSALRFDRDTRALFPRVDAEEEISGNSLFDRLDVVVTHAVGARNRIQHHPEARWMDPVPDHKAVLDAVAARDPDAVETAMRHALRESDEDLRSGEPPFDRA